MADHLRQQIRLAAATRLLAHPGVNPDNVFPGRSTPLRPDQLPALLIWTPDEQVERSSMGGDPVIDRVVQVRVEARVAITDGTRVDDALDALAIDVEVLLQGSDLGGLTTDLTLVETVTELIDEGDAQHGAQALTFEGLYRTKQSDPTAPA